MFQGAATGWWLMLECMTSYPCNTDNSWLGVDKEGYAEGCLAAPSIHPLTQLPSFSPARFAQYGCPSPRPCLFPNSHSSRCHSACPSRRPSPPTPMHVGSSSSSSISLPNPLSFLFRGTHHHPGGVLSFPRQIWRVYV